MMKPYLVSGVLAVVLAFAVGAARADEPGYDFSGPYAGVHAGLGVGDADWTNNLGSTFGPLGSGGDFDLDGFVGGGQLGYMHQMGQFVFGADVSLSVTDLDESITGPVATFPNDVWNVGLDYLVLTQARLGWTHDRWLIFVQGGYAGAEGTADAVANPGASFQSLRDARWHNGWTIGGGFLVKIDEAFSIGAEYSYVDLESKRYRIDVGIPGDRADVEHDLHILKITGTIHLRELFGGM